VTPVTDRIKEAETARDELADALRAAGITLPSLNVDILTYVNADAWPLVDLGRCNVRTVRRLASVLRATTAAPAEPGK
jgi:hypothetical protein